MIERRVSRRIAAPHRMWIASGYVLVSIVTFVVYGFDKRRAVHGERREPERTLHGLEVVGGWPGALMGQMVFRHKPRKLSYMLVFLGVMDSTLRCGLPGTG